MRPSTYTISYTLASAFCGTLSFLILIFTWHCVSGVNIKLLAIAFPVYLLCWGLAGFIGWCVSKNFKWLAMITYSIVNILIILPVVVSAGITDSSINAWIILYIIGILVISLPSFLLLKLVEKRLKSKEMARDINRQ